MPYSTLKALLREGDGALECPDICFLFFFKTLFSIKGCVDTYLTLSKTADQCIVCTVHLHNEHVIFCLT